ncbi:MAG: fused MFS/spermidine synthase [Candidatus Binatia bacterium]
MIRPLLYAIVFMSGAVLMGLEIVGSRVLSPYFGNSIFVWGSLISVVLTALSLGYYLGGWLSARSPSFVRLLILLLIPGVLIFLLPFLYPLVNHWIAKTDFGIRLNPLIASVVFFLLPSIFLGTVSPYAIRLSATALSTVGSTAGTFYALSTCGSVFGTLFTAFYLIPMIGVSNIIHSLGMTLMALSGLSWPLAYLHRSKRALTFFSLAVISGIVASTSRASTRSIFVKDSFYHRIRVEEDDKARYLYFDRTLQSAMNLDDPTSLRLVYPRFASLGLALRPDASNVLIIGLGGGSIAKKYHREFPSMEIDVAEIDPEVIQVAKRYFFFQEGRNLRVHAQDGRLYLMHTPRRYDLVLLDAYYADAIPFHLTTREFFQTADQKLTLNGVMVINIIGAISGPKSKMVRSLVKTLRETFPQIYLFPTLGADNASIGTTQNVIILASKDKERLNIAEIVKRAASLGRDLFPDPIDDIAASYYEARMPADDVPVLTDDYAPTDSLLHY